MATSSISSLGLGSDGVLSYDVIDQLRKVDESALLNPIDANITTNKTKQSDLSTLTTMTATLKSATSALADEGTYLKRSTSVSNTAVSVTASAGTAVQDFTVRVDKLAQRDIYQSKGIASETASLGLSADTLKLSVNGINYDIKVTASTTLEDLQGKINDVAGDSVTASILNVGGTDPYKLVIKADNTGAKNTISFSSTTNIQTTLKLDDSTNHLQTARDASFYYNDVAITRSSNTVTDLVVGMSLTLNEEQDSTESTTVKIKQDTSEIKDNLDTLVSAYNQLISNLNEATKYDSDSDTAGTFQGVNQITSLSSSIRSQILNIDSSGRSLVDYGLSLNESGLLEFDSSKFNDKMEADSAGVEKFFRGTSTETEVKNGFFTDFNELLKNYTSTSDGILTLYAKTLTDEKTSLTEERATTVSRLDDKYDTMTARFASYDSIISKLTNQFNSLSLMIKQSYTSSN